MNPEQETQVVVHEYRIEGCDNEAVESACGFAALCFIMFITVAMLR